MIDFKELNETRNELKDVERMKNEIGQTKSNFSYECEINTKYMNHLNRFIGRNMKQTTKADVHTFKGFKDNNDTETARLEISRKGIGATTSYRQQIETYDALFYDTKRWNNPSQGLVPDVIKNQEVFNKLPEFLNEKGMEILNILKMAVEKTNITKPESFTITKEFKFSDDEMKFFNLNSTNGVMQLHDNGGKVYLQVNGIRENYGIERYELFAISDIYNDDEKHFTYMIFINNHMEEFDSLIKEYKTKTKEERDRWEMFDNIMKEKLAKYVLLETM